MPRWITVGELIETLQGLNADNTPVPGVTGVWFVGSTVQLSRGGGTSVEKTPAQVEKINADRVFWKSHLDRLRESLAETRRLKSVLINEASLQDIAPERLLAPDGGLAMAPLVVTEANLVIAITNLEIQLKESTNG